MLIHERQAQQRKLAAAIAHEDAATEVMEDFRAVVRDFRALIEKLDSVNEGLAVCPYRQKEAAQLRKDLYEQFGSRFWRLESYINGVAGEAARTVRNLRKSDPLSVDIAALSGAA